MTLEEDFKMLGLEIKAKPYGQQTWYDISENGECIGHAYNEQQAQMFLIGFIRGTTKGRSTVQSIKQQ